MAGPGAVGGERSEPLSATDSRPQTAQPSLGLRGERANEPVKPSKPERRRHGRTQFHSIAASACSWIASTKSTRTSQGCDGTLIGSAMLPDMFQSARPRVGARWNRRVGRGWRNQDRFHARGARIWHGTMRAISSCLKFEASALVRKQPMSIGVFRAGTVFARRQESVHEVAPGREAGRFDCRTQRAVQPPSMGMAAPVMERACSPQRKTARAATSSTSINRRVGCDARITSRITWSRDSPWAFA